MREKVENFFLWKWLLKAERFVMILCCAAVIITVGMGVVCRYILHINFMAKDELLIIFALWLYFIGGAEGGNYRDEHIKADVLSIFIKKEKVNHIINVIVKVISFVVSILLAVWAFQYLDLCLTLGGETRILGLPMLCSRGALVVGYILPVLYTTYHLILSIKGEDIKKVEHVEGGEPV